MNAVASVADEERVLAVHLLGPAPARVAGEVGVGSADDEPRAVVLPALKQVPRLVRLLRGHAADEVGVPRGAEAVGLRELGGRGRVALAPVARTALGDAVVALDVRRADDAQARDGRPHGQGVDLLLERHPREEVRDAFLAGKVRIAEREDLRAHRDLSRGSGEEAGQVLGSAVAIAHGVQVDVSAPSVVEDPDPGALPVAEGQGERDAGVGEHLAVEAVLEVGAAPRVAAAQDHDVPAELRALSLLPPDAPLPPAHGHADPTERAPADEGDAGALAVGHAARVEARLEDAGVVPQLLRDGVARAADVARRPRLEAEPSRPHLEGPGLRHGVVVPLPLRRQQRPVEVVARGRARDGLRLSDARLLPAIDRSPVVAEHRPAVLAPLHRQQVDDAAEVAGGLEAEEPALAVRQVDEPALVRASAHQHFPALPRATQGLRAQHGLAARLDPALGERDVVLAAPLEELRALGHLAAVDLDAVVEEAPAVRAHLVEDQGSRAEDAVDEVRAAVVVPEGRGVLPAADRLHRHRLRPGPARARRVPHEEAVVRRADEDVELAVVVPQRGRPRPLGVAVHLVVLRVHVEPREDLADDLPVDEVARVQHLHADEVEVRGDEVEVVADADHVGVGVVGLQDGVAVAAVALVAPGEHGRGLRGPRRGPHAEKKKEEGQDEAPRHRHISAHCTLRWRGFSPKRSMSGDGPPW